MWLIDGTPGLFTDFYELTMGQVYFKKGLGQIASFEVTVRRLPEHWGFFVMSGLNEIASYRHAFRFNEDDIDYLRSTGRFEKDFLDHLLSFQPDVHIRALPEGTVFFPNEPVLEVTGPILDAQLLEAYILNILGFSIIETTLAARTMIASRGIPVLDFGLRRCQGPIASLRAARGGQIAGFKGTSNVFAARALDFVPSGTMAHSYVQIHDSEEQAFRDFAEIFREGAVLLVDTYDTVQGIKTAARVARAFRKQTGVEIRGIRIDSGDLVGLSKYAHDYFKQQDLDFLKIFVSGDLDEYRIGSLLEQGAQIDGFGIGTRYGAARHAPAIEIVYKIVEYAGKGLVKTSPGKHTRPGRKTVLRVIGSKRCEKDIVGPLDPSAEDLLKPFTTTEPMADVQQRLTTQLATLPQAVKAVKNPQTYTVEFLV